MEKQFSSQSFGWSQANELNFLETIGTHTQGAPSNPKDVPRERRIKLLEGYLTALKHPRRWFPGADPEALKKKAEELLAEARKRL